MLVPLKATSRGKSRLEVPPEHRAQLSLAMARDTLTAILACPVVDRVLLVVDAVEDATAVTVVDVRLAWHLSATAGLNASIREGAVVLIGAGWTGPVAVLPADLPFLRTADLTAALTSAAGGSTVVSDAEGTGTTLLTAPSPAELQPRYGVDSFARHRSGGAAPLALAADNTVHWDVDRLSELQSPQLAASIGEFTATALAALPVDP